MKGAWFMALGGLIGAVIAGYDYLTPATGLQETGGVMLVLVSCLLMLGASLVLAGRIPGFLAGLLVFLLLLDVIGTGVAGYFLESPVIMGAMALAALGWVMRAIGHAADTSVEVA